MITARCEGGPNSSRLPQDTRETERTVEEADRAIEWGHRGERTNENPATAEYWDGEMTTCTPKFCPFCCEIEPFLYSGLCILFCGLTVPFLTLIGSCICAVPMLAVSTVIGIGDGPSIFHPARNLADSHQNGSLSDKPSSGRVPSRVR